MRPSQFGDFQRGIQRAGLGANLSQSEMETMGFFVCTDDLEDELIRALGAAGVERVIEAQGESRHSGHSRPTCMARAGRRSSASTVHRSNQAGRFVMGAYSWMPSI